LGMLSLHNNMQESWSNVCTHLLTVGKLSFKGAQKTGLLTPRRSKGSLKDIEKK